MATIVSANRLTDGLVVYRTADGDWTPQIEAAAMLSPQQADAALAAARQDERGNLVVDAVLVETEPSSSGPRAKTLRERIRATGPTIAYRPLAVGGR